MSDETRLVEEATALAVRATSPAGHMTPHVGRDVIDAMLVSRANVDRIQPAGRVPRLKRTVLRVCQLFLRDQASFNRAAVVQLEDLAARVERLEAEVAEHRSDADRTRQA